VDWIYLAHDRDRWLAVVSTVPVLKTSGSIKDGKFIECLTEYQLYMDDCTVWN
jgi:hypothetical protein